MHTLSKKLPERERVSEEAIDTKKKDCTSAVSLLTNVLPFVKAVLFVMCLAVVLNEIHTFTHTHARTKQTDKQKATFFFLIVSLMFFLKLHF